MDEHRGAELVGSVAAVRREIAEACGSVGRDPRAVTLIAVTKTHPASDVAALVQLGVLDIGESRDQEAAPKVAETAELLRSLGRPVGPPRWHFLGQLQSRKCRSVARYASAVHSVDRIELVAKLAEAVAQAQRAPLEVFVQVSLDGDPERGGVLPGDVAALASAVADRSTLRLCGVMAVAPLNADPDDAFAELSYVSQRLREQHPAASSISAGMSGDLDAAVRHGATHVRVGSALLGRRRPEFG